MRYVFIYITAANAKEAATISKALVGARLAACTNILPKMESLYWWKGKIESAHEVVLIAKTRQSLVNALIKKVKTLHSYECPCIVALPITAGNPDYLHWIAAETKAFNPIRMQKKQNHEKK